MQPLQKPKSLHKAAATLVIVPATHSVGGAPHTASFRQDVPYHNDAAKGPEHPLARTSLSQARRGHSETNEAMAPPLPILADAKSTESCETPALDEAS